MGARWEEPLSSISARPNGSAASIFEVARPNGSAASIFEVARHNGSAASMFEVARPKGSVASIFEMARPGVSALELGDGCLEGVLEWAVPLWYRPGHSARCASGLGVCCWEEKKCAYCFWAQDEKSWYSRRIALFLAVSTSKTDC